MNYYSNRDFGDETDYYDEENVEDWEGFWDDPEEFVVNDEVWEELTRILLDSDEQDND